MDYTYRLVVAKLEEGNGQQSNGSERHELHVTCHTLELELEQYDFFLLGRVQSSRPPNFGHSPIGRKSNC